MLTPTRSRLRCYQFGTDWVYYNSFACGIEITAVELYARYIKIKVVKVRFYFDSSPLFFDGSRALEQGCVDGPAELKYRSKFLKMRG